MMPEKLRKHFIATAKLPITLSLQAMAKRLNATFVDVSFMEEDTGRFEEVPAFVSRNEDGEFILFGIPDGEAGEFYILEFDGERMLEIDECVKSASQLVGIFAASKEANHHGYIDYSEELANLLRNLGYGECVPLPQVD